MSDYIKREDAEKLKDICTDTYADKEYFIEQLKSIPSADVVENVRVSPILTATEGKPVEYVNVVRCKDCIHNGSIDTDCPFGWRDKRFNLPDPNDYCSYGERRDDECE